MDEQKRKVRAKSIGKRSDRTMLTVSALAVTALAVIVLVNGQTTSKAAESAQRRLITVTGRGVVTVMPDIATITAGVVSQAKTAAAALHANSEAVNDMIGVLKRGGIAAKDMQTTNLLVQPRQRHFRDGRPPEVTGYVVTNQLRLIVRNIDQLGALLDKIVSAGANQIHGISFKIANGGNMRDKARIAAITDARRKAELYARAAGARIGQIVSISEQGAGGPRPQIFAERMAAAPVPIAQGSQTLEVHVTTSWLLE